MSIARLSTKSSNSELKRARVEIQPTLSFLDKDKMGTIQPHDDTLVVTLRIGGYDIKRVMVDQGSIAKIIYPDLYRGLNLKPENLTTYDSPLVSFDWKVDGDPDKFFLGRSLVASSREGRAISVS